MEPQPEKAAPEKAGHMGDNVAARAGVLYQRLFELMPGSVVLMNTQGRVLDANPAFCQQIGYAREELFGHHVSLFSQDSMATIERNLDRMLAGEVLRHEVTNFHKDGNLRYYELHETAITMPDGSRGILALSNDITERVAAEKEKLELQRQFLHAENLKSLGIMAAGIAHDFNNLIAAIIGNIELGLMELGEKPAVRAVLRDAITAANRAAHLTGQMLAYSGRGLYAVAELDLNEIIRRMTEMLSLTISHKASLELRVDSALPFVEGDVAQLQQVVVNLVTNASEALGDGPGLISIATSVRDCDATCLAASRTGGQMKPGMYVVLEISDTGCGMDESMQQHLFDPFFTTKFVGRGLGMSAVLGAVKGHNGGILVSSKVNQGTTISLLLPVPPNRSSPEPRLGDLSTVEAVAIAGTVLVADDEAIMRSMIERILKRTGLRVLLAADGMEAIALFKQHADEITFVLLDLTMPTLDGVQTLAELRRLKPNVKAVLTSGYNKGNIGEHGMPAGFVAFIPKPYRAGNLIEVARQICAGER